MSERRSGRKAKDIWKLFTRIPGVNRATCNECRKSISFTSSTYNLKKHLKNVHCELYSLIPPIKSKQNIPYDGTSPQAESHFVSMAKFGQDSESESDDDDDDDNDSETLGKRLSSKESGKALMKYYYTDSGNEKIAECKVCSHKIAYRTTKSNLKRHLKRKHNNLYDELQAKLHGMPIPNNILAAKKTNYNNIAPKKPNSKHLLAPKTPNSNNLLTPKQEVFIDAGDNNFVEYEVIAVEPSDSLAEVNINDQQPNMVFELTSANKQRKFASSNLNENVAVLDALMLLFTVDLQPFNIVEDEGFVAFTKALNSSFKLPTINEISSTLIPSAYNKSIAYLKNIVVNEAKSVCLSINNWSSFGGETFIEVTSHFVTDKFELKSILLDVVNISGYHNELDLSSALKDVTDEWGVSDRVNLVVTYESPNLIDSIFELGWKYSMCYARTLSCIVEEAIMLLNHVFDKVKLYVQYFMSNTSAEAKLLSIYRKNRCVSDEIELILSVPDRWLTTYYMVERFICFEEAINLTLEDIGDMLPEFSVDEWILCKQFCELLKPFEEVSKKMSEEKYMLGSSAIVITTCLLRVMDNFDNEIERVINEIRLKLKRGLEDKFSDLETIEPLAVCTFLDPRFKVHGFRKMESVQIIKRQIRDRVEAMYNEKASAVSTLSTKCESSDSHLSVWDEFDKAVSSVKCSNSFLSDAIQELEMYLNDYILPRDKSPLEWWKNHRFVYPNLAKIYLEKCNVIASSLPCQRLFTEHGFLMEERRARLGKRVREVLFLNANQ